MLKEWKPVDYIIVVITVTICTIMLTSVLYSVYAGIELSTGGLKLLHIILVSFVSIISMYVGARIQEKKDANKKS